MDESTQTYYLGDRSNKVVDVVDAKTGKFTKQIPATPPFKGFTGSNDTSGPNGVVAAFPWLFVTDGGSRVVTIDLRTDATVSDVVTRAADANRAQFRLYRALGQPAQCVVQVEQTPTLTPPVVLPAPPPRP